MSKLAPHIKHNQSFIKIVRNATSNSSWDHRVVSDQHCVSFSSQENWNNIIQCLLHNGILSMWSLLVFLHLFVFLLICFFIDLHLKRYLRRLQGLTRDLVFAQTGWLNRVLSHLPWRRSTCLLHREKGGNEFLLQAYFNYGAHGSYSSVLYPVPLLHQPCRRIASWRLVGYRTSSAKEMWIEWACVASRIVAFNCLAKFALYFHRLWWLLNCVLIQYLQRFKWENVSHHM